MGAPKLLLRVGERTLLERALAAAAAFPRIVVAGPEVTAALAPAPGLRVVPNDAPERGMTHSLRLAAAVAEPGAALAVVLADTPFVDAELLERVVRARGEADVAYPVRAGRPGHPVVFGPRPRAELAGLPDGDTLRDLRADPRWTRVEIPIDDDRPYIDVDTPQDIERARHSHLP
jgi:CTP:molybdopterin cytidylyltransferase MocA